MFLVYVLYSVTLDRYYIGCTSNIEERLTKHNTNHSGFTGRVLDWQVRYTEHFDEKSKALAREKQMKSWKSRKMIEKLISSTDS